MIVMLQLEEDEAETIIKLSSLTNKDLEETSIERLRNLKIILEEKLAFINQELTFLDFV